MRGRPFQKGQPRPAGAGRRRGTPNHVTAEAAGLCRALVDDAAYRERFRQRLLTGKLAPALEVMVWAYAYGRPTEQHEVEAITEQVTDVFHHIIHGPAPTS